MIKWILSQVVSDSETIQERETIQEMILEIIIIKNKWFIIISWLIRIESAAIK